MGSMAIPSKTSPDRIVSHNRHVNSHGIDLSALAPPVTQGGTVVTHTFKAYGADDIPAIVDIVAEEVPQLPSYKAMRVDKGRIDFVLRHNVTNSNFMCVLLMADGVVVGGVAGQVTMLAFSTDPVATDVFFFIKPEHRSLWTADQLIIRYVEWARARKCVLIMASHRSGHRDAGMGKLLERHGFEYVGGNYHLREDM